MDSCLAEGAFALQYVTESITVHSREQTVCRLNVAVLCLQIGEATDW